jgi:hypothetical protein
MEVDEEVEGRRSEVGHVAAKSVVAVMMIRIMYIVRLTE